MPFKEIDIEKKYYSIGEVADMFQVATSLIRFWETEFDTINPKKNRKGNRQYTKEDISNIKLVHHLVKEKGFTLQGAKEALKNERQKVDDNLEMIESLKKVRSFLEDLKSKLP